MQRPLCSRQQDKGPESRRYLQSICKKAVWEELYISDVETMGERVPVEEAARILDGSMEER